MIAKSLAPQVAGAAIEKDIALTTAARKDHDAVSVVYNATVRRKTVKICLKKRLIQIGRPLSASGAT